MSIKTDHSIYQALTWGICKEHYRKAFYSRSASFLERIGHIAIATFELIPVIGQVLSIAEVSLFPSSHSSKQDRPKIAVQLPKNYQDLRDSLSFLHRQIDELYSDLPWPSPYKKVVVLTEVRGGKGDISAAAKVITILQTMHANLRFDWIIYDRSNKTHDAASFLDSKNLRNVTIRKASSIFFEPPFDESDADLLILGPVRPVYSTDAFLPIIQRTICGPTFAFLEIAELSNSYDAISIDRLASEKKVSYKDLHPIAFRSSYKDQNSEALTMGLHQGSGVLLDPQRMKAPLSQGYFCHSYLDQLQDIKLKGALFDCIESSKTSSLSINSGYAHNPKSWEQFIDCVAIHEKYKDICIVLNQKGAYDELSTQDFATKIFTPERILFLQSKGYTTITVEGADEKITLVEEEKHRKLIVILRPYFFPHDIKCLQLASERLLATGDNSAIEAFCSRCILYLYEDVANGGSKWKFLQQQVDLAKTISPKLSQLLAFFGNDRREKDAIQEQQELAKIEHKLVPKAIQEILNDPTLADATLEFCQTIQENYSFDPILKAAIKRSLWHHLIPELIRIEAETIDPEFQQGFIDSFRKKEKSKDFYGLAEKTLTVKNLDLLKRKIDEAI